MFTVPALIADIAYQNKAAVYDILFKTSTETLITLAAGPKHLGARIGLTAVLHTWGSALSQVASTTLRAVKSPLEHLSPGPLPPA